MQSQKLFLQRIQAAAEKNVLFLPHAVTQMSRPTRMITPTDIHRVIDQGEIIEDYPEDKRGHSCLMLGTDTEGKSIHVVCAPKKEFLVIITAYRPSETEWKSGFRKRRNR